MNTVVLSAIAVLISTRLLSMAAYSPAGRRLPWLELFFVERWILFRGLILISGVIIAAYAISAHAWGHGLGNGALAVFTLLPRSVYRASWVRTAYHSLLRSAARRRAWFVGGAAGCAVLAAVTASADERIAELFQGAGGWLLVNAMFAMMMDLWGARSAASWPFVTWCLIFDGLLLVGAVLLASKALIILEIATLCIEVSLAAAKWRRSATSAASADAA